MASFAAPAAVGSPAPKYTVFISIAYPATTTVAKLSTQAQAAARRTGRRSIERPATRAAATSTPPPITRIPLMTSSLAIPFAPSGPLTNHGGGDHVVKAAVTYIAVTTIVPAATMTKPALAS